VSPWLRKSAFVVVGALALVGLVTLLLPTVLPLFLPVCESTVLARAVSPRGDQAAEHVRLVCENPLRITHTISIGPAEVAPRELYRGYQFYERIEGRADDVEPINPAVLWWDDGDTLSVIYPRGIDYVDGVEIAGVTLRAATRRELE
jgi:hypothetical protein